MTNFKIYYWGKQKSKVNCFSTEWFSILFWTFHLCATKHFMGIFIKSMNFFLDSKNILWMAYGTSAVKAILKDKWLNMLDVCKWHSLYRYYWTYILTNRCALYFICMYNKSINIQIVYTELLCRIDCQSECNDKMAHNHELHLKFCGTPESQTKVFIICKFHLVCQAISYYIHANRNR